MNVWLAIGLSTALAGFALWKHALTMAGTTLAWAFCVTICCFGGAPAFLILAVAFLCTVAADKFAGKRADPLDVRRKTGKRDAARVFCNVGIAAAMILIFGLTCKAKFLLVYAAVMAESLSDSLASKLGPLGKGRTVDIYTLRETSVGLSGGVSRAGSAAALAGAGLIGALCLLFDDAGAKQSLLVAAAGFLGCLLDSVLGSLAQVKYRCPVCGMVTEREQHCGINTVRYRGCASINNDIINLLSNCFSSLLAVLIL